MTAVGHIQRRHYYLVDNPPARKQYRERRAPLSGVIVIHTAENRAWTTPPDKGAEGVASFIRGRSSPGSYHSITDSAGVVPVIPPDLEAFHDGTGTNRHSLSVAFACRADQWGELQTRHPVWVADAVEVAAAELRLLMDYVTEQTSVRVPLKRISVAGARAGHPGFIGHGDLDPGRRSDPGPEFPWPQLFDAIRRQPTKDPVANETYLRQQMADDLSEIRVMLSLAYNPTLIVERAYEQILGRNADAEGLTHWVNYLTNGGSVSDMVDLFKSSPEAGVQE